MAIVDIEWDIGNHGHLFKYPSQWGPNSNTCGGYLIGKLSLSNEVIPQVEGDTRRLLISVAPDYGQEDQEMVREELGEHFLNIHPAIIKVVRTVNGTTSRRGGAEPVPNSQHGVQEISIRREGGKLLLYICNKTSGKDDHRNIPPEDFIFELTEENGAATVRLGDGKDALRLCILIPKIGDKRGELNICSVLRSRVSGEMCEGVRFNKLRNIFDGAGNSFNRHKVRLMAEVFEDTRSLGSSFSCGIRHTADINVGTLELKEALPRFSCEMGGSKVLMVSEFKNWHKTAMPYFSLVDRDGLRLTEYACKHNSDEKCPGFLVQPEKELVSNDGKSLTFFTPAQPHIEDWKKKELGLYLQVKRPEAPEVEEAVSLKRFPFHYANHARIPSDLPLCFHDDSPDEVSVENGRNSRSTSEDADMVNCSLPKQTGPGRKRRILHKEKPEDSAKVSKRDLAASHLAKQPEQELTGNETEPEVPAYHISERADNDEGSGVGSSTIQMSAHQSIPEHNIPNDLFLFLFSNATTGSEDISGSAANEPQQESSESPWMNLAAPDRPSHFGTENYVHEQETSSVRSVQHNHTHEDLVATDHEGMLLVSKNLKLL